MPIVEKKVESPQRSEECNGKLDPKGHAQKSVVQN
jgi:hypothetical protein